jgi:competence protein ComGC
MKKKSMRRGFTPSMRRGFTPSWKKEPGNAMVEMLGTVLIMVILLLAFRAQIAQSYDDAVTQTTNDVKQKFTTVNTTVYTLE